MDALEKCQEEIRRLHTVCRSKDVVIQSACDMIRELLDQSDKTEEQKETFLSEIKYFEENKG